MSQSFLRTNCSNNNLAANIGVFLTSDIILELRQFSYTISNYSWFLKITRHDPTHARKMWKCRTFVFCHTFLFRFMRNSNQKSQIANHLITSNECVYSYNIICTISGLFFPEWFSTVIICWSNVGSQRIKIHSINWGNSNWSFWSSQY